VNEPAPPEARPAGFWVRAGAFLLDGLLIVVVQRSLRFAAARVGGPAVENDPTVAGLAGLFTLLFTAVYTTVLHALTGQTVGKVAFGVRVVSAEGGPLPVGAALLRWLAYAVSMAPLGFGFLMAGLRGDRRALHDLIAGSRVEHLPARLPADVRLDTSPPVTPG
jgi:uncharacterized RDD family membrane protein YckC